MVTIEAETLSPAVLQDPEMWTHGQVALWLKQSGFEEYADLIAFKHKVRRSYIYRYVQIDGPALLHLHEHDFREQPLKIDCLGDIKRLAHSIDVLRCKLDDNQAYLTRQASGSGSTDAGHNEFVRSRLAGRRFHINADQLLVCVGYDNHIVPVANCDPKVLQQNLPPGVIEDLATQPQEETKFLTRLQLISREELIRTVESPDSEAKSLLKMVVAFLYCVMSVAITAFVMVVVHDRVPDMKTYPPLPDIVLDNVPLIPWAFECCELIGLVLAFISVMVLVFYKHRVIIARRMFSLLGSVFLLRCFTMLITSMSVPGIHLECTGRRYGNFAEKFRQAYIIFSGAGMSVQGVRTCGDYMFSGHTSVLTLLNYFITEYTPDSWTTLHTTTWVMNAFGVFFILAAHEHYSIDVFIAFYISSRMFMYYHAYAYNQPSLITSTSPASNSRMRLWFPLGWFFEAGGNGRVENEYDIPIGYPNLAWWRTQWWSLAGYTQVVDKNALAETMQELTSDEATTATVKDSLPSSTRMRRAPVE